jgi:predicted PurR-regulated permease PerM
MMLLSQSPSFLNHTGAVIVLLFLVAVAFIIAICWLVFPFIVISKCNELVREAKSVGDIASDILAEQRRANEMAAERNKAMQWEIDNWKEEPSVFTTVSSTEHHIDYDMPQ